MFQNYETYTLDEAKKFAKWDRPMKVEIGRLREVEIYSSEGTIMTSDKNGEKITAQPGQALLIKTGHDPVILEFMPRQD